MPLRSFMSRVGGKSRLAKKILAKFPKEFSTYTESFVGGGSLFMLKKPSKIEVISDTNKNIYHIWSDMKRVGDQVANMKFSCSKQEFERLKKLKTTDPVTRLYRNLYINKMSFGGMGLNVKAAKFCKGKLGQYIKSNASKIKNRLKHVLIKNQDWKKIVTKYNGSDTMHYLDPPYETVSNADWLYKPMKATDLIKTLKRIKGKFLLSFEDTTSTRRTFQNAGFRVERIKTSYSIQPLKSVNKSELIVMNY